MLEDKEFRERFGTEETQQVYQLSLTLESKEKKEEIAVEYVDAYPGEVGLLYAQKLLFRWANLLLKNTDYKDKVWEEYRIRPGAEKAQLAARKRNDGTFVAAYLRYMA